MVSSASEVLNEKLREEFKMSYSENELWQMYLKEYEVIFNTNDYLGAVKDEHFAEFIESVYEDFKEERLG